MRGNHKGIMGSIRSVSIHPSGSYVAAAGLGRFAYVYNRSKRQTHKVFLKQKLTAILLSNEAGPGGSDGGSESSDYDNGHGSDGDITGDEESDHSYSGRDSDIDDSDDDDDEKGDSADEGEEGDDSDDDDDDDDDDDSGDEAPAPKKGAKRAAQPVKGAKRRR